MTAQLPMLFDASRYTPEFCPWLSDNWHVWHAFAREANRIWDSGRRHWSARTICEYLRHETALRQVGGDWKIDNDHIPDLARYFQDTFKDRAELFATRLMPNARRAA